MTVEGTYLKSGQVGDSWTGIHHNWHLSGLLGSYVLWVVPMVAKKKERCQKCHSKRRQYSDVSGGFPVQMWWNGAGDVANLLKWNNSYRLGPDESAHTSPNFSGPGVSHSLDRRHKYILSLSVTLFQRSNLAMTVNVFCHLSILWKCPGVLRGLPQSHRMWRPCS